MFGLTKREQRWAAEQKAAETIVPLLTAAIEARTAMDTNERIAQLERDLAAAQAERDALFRSKSTLNTRVLAAEAEVQALRVAHEAALAEAVAKEREACAAQVEGCAEQYPDGFTVNARNLLRKRAQAIRARGVA